MRCTNREEGVPDLEWGVRKRSADVDGGARNVIEERLSGGAAIHAEHHRNGREVKSLQWNRGAPNRGQRGDWGMLNQLSMCQSRLRSANRDWDATIPAEVHHWGGGYEAAHHVELMSIAVASAVIQSYHCGRAKFTFIFILRKHNRNLLASVTLRHRTMNCCGHHR